MTITLYLNNSDKSVVNKSLIKVATLTGNFRNAVSILNPIVEIEFSDSTYAIESIIADNSEIIDSDNDDIVVSYENILLTDINYIYINDFHRYYFVDSISALNNKMYAYNCSIDVLMTYKDKIYSLNAYVKRNQYNYNKLIDDEICNFRYNREVEERDIVDDAGATYVNTTFNVLPSSLEAKNNMIINLIVKATEYPYSSESDFPIVRLTKPPLLQYTNKYSSGLSTFGVPMAFSYADLISLATYVIADDTLKTYINSVTLYPYNLNVYDALHSPTGLWKLRFGDTIVDVSSFRLQNPFDDIRTINEFTITKNDLHFYDYEPYTELQLYIPYLGWRTFNTNDIYNNKITISYLPNYLDGSASVVVLDNTNNKLLLTESCQLGIKIGISTTNNRELQDQKFANNLNLVLGTIGSTLAIGGGVATGNVLAIGGGALSLGKTIGNAVVNNTQLYEKGNASVTSGKNGASLPQNARIRFIRKKPINYDSSFAELYGYPLYEYHTLSDLTGFTQIAECHLDSFTNATKNELDELYVLLKEGIIL